jgi:hypothetical protein
VRNGHTSKNVIIVIIIMTVIIIIVITQTQRDSGATLLNDGKSEREFSSAICTDDPRRDR